MTENVWYDLLLVYIYGRKVMFVNFIMKDVGGQPYILVGELQKE